MKKLRVSTQIAGARCVIFNHDSYIEDRISVMQPDISFIEVVRRGFVLAHTQVFIKDAPETMIRLMKEYMS